MLNKGGVQELSSWKIGRRSTVRKTVADRWIYWAETPADADGPQPRFGHAWMKLVTSMRDKLDRLVRQFSDCREEPGWRLQRLNCRGRCFSMVTCSGELGFSMRKARRKPALDYCRRETVCLQHEACRPKVAHPYRSFPCLRHILLRHAGARIDCLPLHIQGGATEARALTQRIQRKKRGEHIRERNRVLKADRAPGPTRHPVPRSWRPTEDTLFAALRRQDQGDLS